MDCTNYTVQKETKVVQKFLVAKFRLISPIKDILSVMVFHKY